MAHQSQNHTGRDVCPPAPTSLLSRGGQCSVDDAVSMRLCASLSPQMRRLMLARRRERSAAPVAR